MHEPEVGGMAYYSEASARRVADVTADTVALKEQPRSGALGRPSNVETEEMSHAEFQRRVHAGRLVYHPPCDYCGLPYDPADPEERPPLHYGCWFQEEASVAERCEAEVGRAGSNMMAAEALRADADPEAHLLEVIGDPGRLWWERDEAEMLLTHAVSTSTLIEARVQCPNCYEGESFPMDPETGAVTCHCGEPMKPPDEEVAG